jgi:hypothetical protein
MAMLRLRWVRFAVWGWSTSSIEIDAGNAIWW